MTDLEREEFAALKQEVASLRLVVGEFLKYQARIARSASRREKNLAQIDEEFADLCEALGRGEVGLTGKVGKDNHAVS